MEIMIQNVDTFLADQEAFAIALTELSTVKDQLSVVNEQNTTLLNFLILFVQHFECTFSRDTFMNVNYAEEYIKAATYLKDTYKREGDIITHVELWIEEQNQKF